jgi:hypothetical protein
MAEKHLFTPAGTIPCQLPCNTPFFQEQTVPRGGAAVMQMVLGCERVGLSPLPSQTDLFNQAVALNQERPFVWYIDPVGLKDTLMARVPSTFNNVFVVDAFPDRDTVNSIIRQTIDIFEVAPAVLVNSGKQWVAVVGYGIDDNTGLLDKFWVRDPSPPPLSGSATPLQAVAAATWNTNDYWLKNPVDPTSTVWGGQFAAVCDPKAEPEPLRSAQPVLYATGTEILAPELAVELARRVLEEEGLLDQELFRRAVESCEPSEPSLVRRVDVDDQFYYLVRFQPDVGQDLAVVAVDARFGSFLEAIAYPDPVASRVSSPDEVPSVLEAGVPTRPSVELARDRLIARVLESPVMAETHNPALALFELRDVLGVELARLRQPGEAVTFRREEILVHQLMVWRPCGPTNSLLYPWYLVSTPIKSVYVRAADGLISTDFDDDCLPFAWQLLGG